MRKKISLIMPTFNEKENIEKAIFNLVNFLEINKLDYEIIIVDDNSTDGTIEIIKEIINKNNKIKIIIRKEKFGFGSALVDGTKEASNEIITWVMADSSDDLNTILKMINAIEVGGDIVIGSRNIKGASRGDQNVSKAVGSRIYSFIAKILFNLPVYDITNAFRTFRKKTFDNVVLKRNDFAISPEFSIKAHRAGFKLKEVPTTYNERKIGEAKTKLLRMGLLYFRLLFRYRFIKL
jgi:dolichol-phosphate mannosyltransferase